MLDMYKEKNPLTVCLIGVLDKDKVLLVKRKREPFFGYWGLIGGRQTFGEAIKNVASQEVMEETGFAIKNPKINGMYSEILLDENDEVKDHFLFVVVKAELDRTKKRSENIENTDVEDFKWFCFPVNEEDKKYMIPSDVIMLNNFDSDKLVFKEFVMKEAGNELKLVRVIV
jgi:ADP-ribose pyrophosphatase YjhB (NUDIX family)